MEMCFLSKGIYNYLDVKLDETGKLFETGDFYKVKMIEKNTISYMLSPLLREVDGILYLRYNITSSYVLDRMFSRLKPDGELLKLIINQVMECVEDMENYLLSPDDLVIKPEYMFYNSNDKKINLIYVPGYKKPIKSQLRAFLEYIMKIFDHRDKEGITSLYALYDYLTREDFDMGCIREVFGKVKSDTVIGNYERMSDFKNDIEYNMRCKDDLDKKSHKDIKAVNSEDTVDSQIISNQRKLIIGIIGGLVVAFCFGGKFFLRGGIVNLYVFIGLLIVIFTIAVLFLFKDDENVDEIMEEYNLSCSGNDEVSKSDNIERDYIKTNSWKKSSNNYINENELICVQENNISRIVPLTNGGLDNIELSNFTESIIIGRDKKDTDYRLPTTQISRIHACIYKAENDFFLEDRDSTNGTFLNHNRLPALSKQKLERGDIIGFANEEFFVS